MHLITLGIGAVGGFYAAKLVKHYELKISLIARGQTFSVLTKNGLTLIENNSSPETYSVNVYQNYSDLDIKKDELTVVLLCTKSKDTIAASENIKQKLTANTVVVSIQNGVENEFKIASILGKQHVIGALTNIAATNLSPGVIEQRGNYSLIIGELDGSQSARIQAIHQALLDAGIKVHISSNITIDLWSKLVWNAGFNPLSVLHQASTGELLGNATYREQIIGIMKETCAVAKAQGISLPANIIEDHIHRTDIPEWYDFKTSMLQDFEKGKEIELEDILGVVVHKAAELGIESTYSNVVYQQLKTMNSNLCRKSII